MDSLDAYVAATGRNVTVLPPGQVFAYDWHRVRLHMQLLDVKCSGSQQEKAPPGHLIPVRRV